MNDHAFANQMKTKYLALLLPVLAISLTSCGGDKESSPAGTTTPPPATTTVPPSSVPVPPSSVIVPPSSELPSTSTPAPTEGLVYDFCDETIGFTTADFASTIAPAVTDLKSVFDATAGSIVTAATIDSGFLYKLPGDDQRPLKFGKSAEVASQFTLNTSKAVTKVIVSFASWNKITASLEVNGVSLTSSAPGVISGVAIVYEDLTFTISSSSTLVFKVSERSMVAAITLI